MLDAALDYVARGWPVLPVKPGGKIPLVAHGLKSATVDDGQVRRWWNRWPHANIGIRTGVAFDVLDVDGNEGLANLPDVDDHLTVDGPTVSTGGGGWHA